MSNDSKINIDLKEEELEDKPEQDNQMDEMQKKYKEFFIVYDDHNVRVCDGE